MTDTTERARELLAGITPGEWIITFSGPGMLDVGTEALDPMTGVPTPIAQVDEGVDAAFIAAAPELVTNLLSRIEEVEAENAELREGLKPFGEFGSDIDEGFNLSTPNKEVPDEMPYYGRNHLVVTYGDFRRAASLTGGGE